MSRLQIDGVTKKYRGQRAPAVREVSLTLKQGELLALVGESGCGKTTLLRMIAGFEQPTKGRVLLGDREVCSQDGGLPPEKRNVGLVFQEASLFPHLTVRQNIEFGLSKWSGAERTERADEMLYLVGLQDAAMRHPHLISGGQAQRAALARALAPRPNVLLLDEPFSSLDVILKRRLIVEVREILRKTGTTALLVTHERNDAFAFADRIAVMRRGAVLQVGSSEELYRAPRNAYVANFLGRANMLPVEHTNSVLRTALGRVPEDLAAVCDGRLPVRPDQLAVARGPATGLPGHVLGSVFLGEYTEVTVKTVIGELVIHAPRQQSFETGEAVVVSFRNRKDQETTDAPSSLEEPVRAP
jgi:iron(III) transport system ATP-binding protein